MPTYEKCGADVHQMVSELVKKNYDELQKYEVTITCLYAYAKRDKNGQPIGDALKTSSGWPALAKIEKTSLKDRVQGKSDAVITIDGDQWKDLPLDRQESLLDHELFHLAVKFDKEGQAVSDDIGRPILKLKKHDWELTGFKTIAERHGDMANEVVSAHNFMANYKDVLSPSDK